MRIYILLMCCLMLSGCGKTGALYLPEETPEAKPQATPAQNTEVKEQDTTSDEKAD